MSSAGKPMPDVTDPLVAPFWAATRESRLVLPRCIACHYLWWPPEPICPECQTPAPSWQEVAPTGSLWSFAIYHRALDPAFADDIPYAVGLVQLDAGPKMYGIMRGPLADLQIGQRVRAEFERVDDAVTFVRWRCVASVTNSEGGGSG